MSGRTHGFKPSPLLALGLLVGSCGDSPTGPELRPPLESLPPDLAELTFTAEGTPTAPYTLLEVRHPEGFRGFVAVDGEGEPVWFFRTEGNPFGATRLPNGHLVLLDNERGLVEVNPAGEVVAELAQEPRPGRFMHHDLTATPDGTVLFLAEEVRPWPAGADSSVTGEAIWEWAPATGALTRRWSAFDHLDPVADQGARSRSHDWLHANAVSLTADGMVLVSVHFLDQVLAIAPDFQRIEWRLGGVNATLPVDDPFSGQHTAAEVAPGRILLFDNGFDRTTERYSRAVEYALGATSAQKVWEWRPDRDNWARVISSARRLPNGNTVVAFGTREDPELGTTGPIEVYEVTEEGEVAWHLTVGGRVASMYRATPLFGF